jgi:SAM-dependent methyltransferase
MNANQTVANPNQGLWEKGDFTRIAAAMRESGEALIDGLGITGQMSVLDLGCGDGTTALPAARRGADVLGVDIARNLVEAGNRRAQEAGLVNCRFQQGDASTLADLPDTRFDLVVSIFGAMFAPRPFDVAGEMAESVLSAVEAGRCMCHACASRCARPTPRGTSRSAVAEGNAVAADAKPRLFEPKYVECGSPSVLLYGRLPRDHVEVLSPSPALGMVRSGRLKVVDCRA